MLIDSLPGEESTAELQAAGLRELEQESEMAGEQLRQTVKQGEQLLASLQVKHLPILHYDSKVCLTWGMGHTGVKFRYIVSTIDFDFLPQEGRFE